MESSSTTMAGFSTGCNTCLRIGCLWELFLAWQGLSQCPYFLLPAHGLSGSCSLVSRDVRHLRGIRHALFSLPQKITITWNKEISSVLCSKCALEWMDSGKQKRVSYGLLGRYNMMMILSSSISPPVSGSSFQILAIARLIVLVFVCLLYCVVGFPLFFLCELLQVLKGTFRKVFSETHASNI